MSTAVLTYFDFPTYEVDPKIWANIESEYLD